MTGRVPPPPRSLSPVWRHKGRFSYLYHARNPFDRPPSTLKFVLIALASAIPAFLLGTTVSSYLYIERQCDCHKQVGVLPRRPESRPSILPSWVEEVVQERLSVYQQQQQLDSSLHQSESRNESNEEERPERIPLWVEDVVNERLEEERQHLSQEVGQTSSNNFDRDRIGNYVRGMATTPKDEFTSLLDLGVPLDSWRQGSTDVLLLYSNQNALPEAVIRNNAAEIVQVPADEAVAKCEYVNVILTDHNRRNQCIAIVPQYESFHIQRWGRLNPHTKNVQSGFPLQHIPYSVKTKGHTEFRTPSLLATEKMWQTLRVYLENLEVVKQELGEVLKRVAVDNTVVVMVCNFGQSELLINYVCSCKARGFDTSNVIVFPTDKETDDLARGLGLNTYYDHRNFENVPKQAAGQYGDSRFTNMMLAKVISVQLVSLLGYDLLFSDVDVIWYKHPLEYFKGPHSPVKDFDVIFQDDGSRTLRYAPYSANSGFYFVRHNDRTRHFLSSLLMRMDEILASSSHQKPMVTLMTEHVTLFGLRAKVISKAQDELPGGYHWNQKSGQFMHDLFDGKVDPYIFHMSWTSSKENKLKYFRQMGEWYVQEACIEKEATQISGFATNGGVATCCSAEPLISCFYRDKPSKIRCDDSPNIDKGRAPFWK